MIILNNATMGYTEVDNTSASSLLYIESTATILALLANSSTDQQPSPTGDPPFIPFGLPGHLFTIMQGMAICSLIASITVSAALLIFLYFFSHHVDTHRPKGGAAKSTRGVMVANGGAGAKMSTMNQNGGAAREDVPIKSNDHAPGRNTTTLPFWKWNIGERFVVYLGIVDLCDGLFNIGSHVFILITHTFPPAPYCKALGFLLNTSDVAQWVVLFLSSLCASSLVVLNKKLKLGRKDWRLQIAVFGFPLALSCIAAGIGAVGAAGST